MIALLTATEAFVLAPLLAMALAALLCILPLPRIVARLLCCVASAVAFVCALYQYTPATDKESDLLERVGPSLRGMVQFRMESVVAMLILSGFALLAALFCASLPMRSPRDERARACSFALATSAALAVVLSKHTFLAFAGLEVLGVACIVHGFTACDGERQRRRHATMLTRQILSALLCAYGIALLYGGSGELSLLGIEAVNRPGIRAPEGLALIGGACLFGSLFLRFGVFPFGRTLRRAHLDAAPDTRLLRTGLELPALCLLLFAAAPLIPRQLLPVLPWLSGATLWLAWLATSFAETRDARDASLASTQIGGMLMAFTALCIGSGVQDAGYAIRAGLLYLVPMGLTWILWIGAQSCLGDAGQRRSAIEQLYGLGHERPALAILLSVAAASFAGLPLTGAFWGRLLLSKAAWSAVDPVFAMACIAAQAAAAIWCVRVLAGLWFTAPPTKPEERQRLFGARRAPYALLFLIAAVLVLLGVMPDLLLDTLVHIKL